MVDDARHRVSLDRFHVELIAFFDVRLYVFGGLGIFGYPCFIDPATNNMVGMYNGMIASAIAFAVGFVLTFPMYRDAKQGETELAVTTENTETKSVEREILVAPVTTLFPTGHAIGLITVVA